MFIILRRTYSLGLLLVSAAAFALLMRFAPADTASVFSYAVAAGLLFIMLSLVSDWAMRALERRLERAVYVESDTRFMNEFLNRLRVCFTTNDFVQILEDVLEKRADCAVLYLNMASKYSVYNSPARLTSDPELFKTLVRQFSDWKDGFFYFDDEIGLTEIRKRARGFFLSYGQMQLFVFGRFIRNFDPVIYPELFREFKAYLDREKTIERMFVISALSKEWELVAETQKTFLPKKMPIIEGVDVASYYRPLVNVSGDYYDVLPIDDKRTLLVLGDVSGKGLAAALIMGIIVNTIKISQYKLELDQLMRAIDSAIKGMRFQDKYTVIFLGLLDTEKQSLKYINASMSEAMIISQGGAGAYVKELPSNCGLIGILDLPEVVVDEIAVQQGDLIFIASDGVTEVTNKEGVQLGDNKLYLSTLKDVSTGSAQEVVDAISDLVLAYNGDRKLRDDITMLAAKVQ